MNLIKEITKIGHKPHFASILSFFIVSSFIFEAFSVTTKRMQAGLNLSGLNREVQLLNYLRVKTSS